MSSKAEPLCPSARHDWDGARLFAVVGGTPERPETAYLEHTEPITDSLLELAGPVEPTEVFRFAAPCARSGCQHFDGGRETCRLAEKTVRVVPVMFETLPKCAIRRDCRWWKQEGVAACKRCPQVVTVNYAPSDAMRTAADPAITSVGIPAGT